MNPKEKMIKYSPNESKSNYTRNEYGTWLTKPVDNIAYLSGKTRITADIVCQVNKSQFDFARWQETTIYSS
jgi:hypothetical protein